MAVQWLYSLANSRPCNLQATRAELFEYLLLSPLCSAYLHRVEGVSYVVITIDSVENDKQKIAASMYSKRPSTAALSHSATTTTTMLQYFYAGGLLGVAAYTC